MRCIKCGYQNIEGLKYCASCGQELMTQEEYDMRSNEKKSSVIRLYVLIGFLSVILVGVIIYFVLNSFAPKPPKEPTSTIDTELIGDWVCKNNQDQENYDGRVYLNKDSSFTWGPYDKIEFNYLAGTYTTKEIEESNENYKAVYKLSLLVTRMVVNGREDTEGSSKINYYIYLIDNNNIELKNMDLESDTRTYCVREKKEIVESYDDLEEEPEKDIDLDLEDFEDIELDIEDTE